MRKMKVSELVLDFDLYPRASINSYHAGEMQRSVEAGAELPPIVICKKSKRIVDGFHRQRVYSRLYGADYEVDVVEKSYRSDRELFLDAARLNAGHGLKMDTHDKAHCILRCIDLGISDGDIAAALHVTAEAIGELRVGRTAKTTDKLEAVVALKRTIQHKAGKTLNKAQVAANVKLSGMNQVFYVNQIITLIEADLLDTSNEDLMARLVTLGELIGGLSVVA